MECQKFNMQKDGEQQDYGIYEFFKNSDTKERLKCSFVIDNEYYIINSDLANGRDHNVLIRQIASEFMLSSVTLYGGSLGGDLEFVCEKEDITYYEVQHMIGMFEELKAYYLDTNKDKSISIYGPPFGSVGLNSNRFDTDDIDEIIIRLNTLIREKGLK